MFVIWDTNKVQVFESVLADFSISVLCHSRDETLRKVVTWVMALVTLGGVRGFGVSSMRPFPILVVSFGVLGAISL